MSKLLTHNRDARDPPRRFAERPTTALRILLRGRVQGLGVRPAIARLAQESELVGSVGNSSDGVTIHVEGPAAAVASFQQQLAGRLPAGARVESRADQPAASIGATAFRIESSTSDGPLVARVPPDVAVCRRCLADVTAVDNRRHGYAFTTCAECGPRYSLIDSMPYDRAATAMKHFVPCSRCAREYIGPADRRFHSQTNGCPECGPQWWLSRSDGRVVARGEAALQAAVVALRGGRILAARGVGGYQLIVDATRADAVRELRRRKGRFGKPLAVMVADLEAARRLAIIEHRERQSLSSPANPIVVVKSRNPSGVAKEVTEGLDTVGVMLPGTPLHFELALRFDRPLVVTSGNLEGDPLAFEDGAAQRELQGVADVCLDHDRPIIRPIDDSVVRLIAGRPATVRLARGLAPLPLDLKTRPMLALGGHQKAAIALSNGAQSVLGPHVGDLETESARTRYLDHIEAMCRLYGARPEWLICDRHPDYFSTRWAAGQSLPTMAVEHHHAHVAAALLEHGWLDREVLGIAWDGTGFGPDGTIWGGELLIATATDYRRAACLRPFTLPGGEMAVREPWRVAVSLVHEAVGPEQAAKLRFSGIPPQEVEHLARLLRKPRLWPITSSAGRLFDGIAALALDATVSEFEGQPAMRLEAACESAFDGEYPLPLSAGEPALLDWRPLVGGVLEDRSAGLSPGAIAIRFHRALAAGIAAVAECFPKLPVVLCGGCFHNKVLTEFVVERHKRSRVATPGIIPTGDGGLAAGQLAICAARIAGGWRPCV
ncbi:MAG: carbamoyltransferase HypF [Pirellulales bacterium]